MTNTTQTPPAGQTKAQFDPSKMEFHRYANMFPLIEGDEFLRLVEDIKTNKLQVPITTYHGQILDGRNRYRAAMEAKYQFEEKDFTPYAGLKPIEFVVSANILRRHLNETQRAMIAAKLITTKLGDNQKSDEATTTKEAATLLNVSEASVKTAKDVWAKGAPEVQAAVQKGEKRLGAVRRLLKKSKEEQAQALLPSTSTPSTRTALDRLEDAWDKADLAQQEAFVETKYDAITKLVKEINKKSKDAA